MKQEIETSLKNYWEKIWGKFLKHPGLIAPSGKLVQLLLPYLPRHASILDLGCGEGRNTLYLGRIGYKVFGIDLSFIAVKLLYNNLFEEEVKGIALTGDARKLPFHDNAFHAILAHNLFDHLDSEGFWIGLKEAYRTLKSNGIILMTIDSLPPATSKDVQVIEDGSYFFVSGTRKGMLLRPFKDSDLERVSNEGWEVLKNEFTPRKSKILILKKTQPANLS
ncbi:MAG: methyltransferase domain-containing protein [Candidatus Riflebacteria bacterium]|nr:methyltransferase domain-containing protein [Candidatus Riflebacteria bacterium]